MRLSDLGRQLDETVLGASASLARRLNRRQLLRGVLGGSAVAVAGVSLGSAATILRTRDAEAHLGHCGGWFRLPGSTHGGSPECGGCPFNGCPSGHSICTVAPGTTRCNGNCTYTNGNWVAQNGLGNCGGGFRLCYDCNPGNCNICTCLSGTLCTGCCSQADVAREMAALAAQAAGAQTAVAQN
jgi:hypothetical protein